MSDKVYQVIELVGTSQHGIEDAINNAVSHAAKAHGKLDWYEVVQTRGFIEGDKTRYFQVNLKIGCHTH
ncbi:protein with a Dodecin-like topology [Legionella geestiana]|uniref:Protein with a Dodecin-like topology n=1 Tax=Legionella geestiana TaxID=45065 RepID=A0A0W0UA43_9GAMM|nr:dodecin [Legionella geestiana]KTD04846.1 protein with a Dodecin-like topology [Legionella geestiana]QBS11326.1 dodecin domain-containing protein [Legionella geestiana]QDQ41020.1 dodecin domain-containing protein [Legionella geestiana]STX54034.1 protein with a Dodecin-like topology [Legionella geestiana]